MFTLPANAYDTLARSCEQYGGVGAFSYWDAQYQPCCIIGHAWAVSGIFYADWYKNPSSPNDSTTWKVLSRLGITTSISDRAVTNGEEGEDTALATRPVPRISFAEWCKRLNITRGPDDV